MSSDLFPLSINYGRIAAWLVERHKLTPDWLKKLQALQKRASESAMELPPGFLAQVQGGEDYPLRYFAIKQIRDKLVETSERGLFGRLAGSAGTWDKLVKAIEKSLVHLGEASQTLSQNVDFEIPFLKRQVDALDKQIADNEKKKADYLRNASNSAAAFQKECNMLGIQGMDIRTELAHYADSVFPHLQKGVDGCKEAGLQEAVAFYSKFAAFVHGKTQVGAELAVLSQIQNDQVEPICTTIEQAARKPPKISPSSGRADLEGSNTQATIQSPPAAEVGIDWDFDIREAAQEDLQLDCNLPIYEAGEIDWDVEVEIEAEEVGIEDNSLSIDWEFVDHYENPSTNAEDTVDDYKEAAANSLVRAIWDVDFRNGLLANLLELQSFLLTRKEGIENDTSGFVGGQVLPGELQSIDGNAIAQMQDSVAGVLSSLNGEKARQLILLKTSPRWLEKVSLDLEKKAGQERKWRKSLVQLEGKRKELQESLMENKLKLAALMKHTKMVRSCAEESISELFSGRKISIVGDLTGVL